MPTIRRNPAEPGYYLRKLTRRVDSTITAVDRTTTAPSTPTPGGGGGSGSGTVLFAHATNAAHVVEAYPGAARGSRVLTVAISTQAQRDLSRPGRILVLPLVPR